MPRQNFLSSDFFVAVSDAEAKTALHSIPDHLQNIKLLKDNTLTQSMRFLFEHKEKSLHTYMDVSMLRLDDQYIRFSLHASYTNGQSFYTDPEISYTLYSFEQAVYAAIKKDFTALYNEQTPPKKRSLNLTQLAASFVGIFFLWKKMIQ
jgi:hypothetical protein